MGEGLPISVAEMHIFKLNSALVEAKGSRSRKVLHLEGGHVGVWNYWPGMFQTPETSPTVPHTLPFPSLTSGSSFSRSNMFSMSMKLVWIILQERGRRAGVSSQAIPMHLHK